MVFRPKQDDSEKGTKHSSKDTKPSSIDRVEEVGSFQQANADDQVDTQFSAAELAKPHSSAVLEALLKEPCFDLSLKWTASEQRSILFKTDLLILLPALLAFVALAVDRSNIAFALTDHLMSDLNMNGNDINTASNLFNIGIIVFEIPWNMIAKKLGPNRFLPCTIIMWGACTIGQGFVKNRSQFFAIRFLVGMFEAGFSPGMAYYLGRFYQNREIASRYSIFWSANGISFAISGLMSLGILNLRGVSNMAGWSWLFIIEGTATTVVGLFALFWFPDGPNHKRALLHGKRGLFTQRQAAILRTRVLLEDPLKSDETKRSFLSVTDILSVLFDWRLWSIVLCTFASSMMQSVVGSYLPYMIQQMGFHGYSAGGLTVPGCVMSIAFGIGIGYGVNRYGFPAFWIAFVNLCAIGAMLWLALPSTDANRYLLYVGTLFLLMFTGSQSGANVSWIAASVASKKRPIALAMYVMTSNCAGIAGNQTLRNNDAPRYRRGLGYLCGTSGAGIVLAFLGHWLLRNRHQQLSRETEVHFQTQNDQQQQQHQNV